MKQILSLAAAAGILASGAALANVPIKLGSVYSTSFRLGDTAPSHSFEFLLNANLGAVLFDVYSDCVTDLEVTRGSNIWSESSASGLGGAYDVVSITPGDTSDAITLPGAEPGEHTRLWIPFSNHGVTPVTVSRADGQSGSSCTVIFRAYMQSSVGVGLRASKNEARAGEPIVLTFAAFEGYGTVPITSNATIDASATRIPPEGVVVGDDLGVFPLVDSGNPLEGDFEVGDGLFSAIYQPSQPGIHLINARMTFVGSPDAVELNSAVAIRVEALPSCGDVNADALIDEADATQIQNCAVGKVPCEGQCDVDGDGVCDSIDANLVWIHSQGGTQIPTVSPPQLCSPL